MRIGTLKHQSLSVVDGFSKQARSMRREFERRFGEPMDVSEKVGGRFLWNLAFWKISIAANEARGSVFAKDFDPMGKSFGSLGSPGAWLSRFDSGLVE
ncbi:MAG: hypothetical protein V9E94_21060 [Microthrixaceae bacterium]